MGKRLLTSVLSAVLILTSIPATGLQVYANEADTVVVSEVEDEVETEVSVEESGETMSTEESEEIADENEVASEESLSESEEESEESVAVEIETEESETEVEETVSEGVEETETESVIETIAEEKLLASLLTTTSDADILYSGEYEDITWTIDENGHLKVEGEGEFATPTTEKYALRSEPWKQYKNYIKTAEVNVTGMTDASQMFYSCKELVCVDLSNFDASMVTNMHRMFAWCDKLSYINFGNIDTANVENMDGMFAQCNKLETLDLSEFNTAKVTDMNSMFYGCDLLSDVDLSSFNTSSVTDMNGMFCGTAFTTIDLGNFDTSKVKDMSHMFEETKLTMIDLSCMETESVTTMACMFQKCKSLTNLNLAGLDTSNVENTSMMFNMCENLTDLDISGFDTDSVIDMHDMFNWCYKLKKLDIGDWNTGNVTNMNSMFECCYALEQLDLSQWDTGAVTEMEYMFWNCTSLISLDVSNFDTSNVTSMYYMFKDCEKLESLDVSSFNTSNVTSMTGMFNRINKVTHMDLRNFDMSNVEYADPFITGDNLETLYTPCNVKISVRLYGDWYKTNGSKITELPPKTTKTMLIAKNKVPVIPDPYITVKKEITEYECGDVLNTDDITVIYYDSDGNATKLTEGYDIIVDGIDMSTPGKKELIIKYNEISASIILDVTYTLNEEKIEILLPETVIIYDSKEHKPIPQISIKENGTILKAEEDYTVSYINNVNAGTEAKIIITGQNNFRGTLEKTFSITPAQLTITAKDKLCVFGDELLTNEDFDYIINGLCGMDSLVTEPLFICPVTDMNVTGIYPIIPYGADAGGNYRISYVEGTLKVQEEKVVYTVTFDNLGQGEEVAYLIGKKAGSLITEPEKPTAVGYVFGGWYKDKACTKVWNFETDTVQGDTTLYACWMIAVEEGEYSFCVQDIKDRSYTGIALKPAVRVYAADGSTLLKSGKDYTIKYYNNTVADTEEESGLGGVNTTGMEGEGGFTKNLPYVVITGKGDYSGSVYRNFHIAPASIGDGINATEGITLKYAEQLTVNAKKDQKLLTSLKYKKNLKAGTDYIVTLTALDVKDASGNPLTEGLTVNTGSAPVIPKGYSGHFTMLVEGTGNYTGSIEKAIYVSDKNHLIKNATISLGKNQKKVVYKDGENITLTPGWYDTKAKKYYKVNADGSLYEEAEKNANDIFIVKVGSSYLRYGIDYIVSYKNNNAVGKANMVITGNGDYSGSKTAGFTITGQAFNTSNIVVGSDFKSSLVYTGRPQTQNNVTLTTKAGDALEYGVHYTISYKNNLKKGTASMKFTAKPESGYTGSITKTFRITAPTLTDAVDVVAVYGEDSIDTSGNNTVLIGDVVYRRNGSRPVDRVQLVNKETGDVLKEGTDYSVNYANNKKVTTESIAVDKLPLMTLKGKGNYTGSIKITFRILEASFEEDENVTIKTSAVKYNAGKKDNYQYKPSVKVLDATIPLSLNKDYKLEYINCMQPQVEAYLTALADGSKTAEGLQDMKPKVVVTVIEGKGYEKGGSRTIDLPIYMTKFTTSNLYVVVSEENTTYTGDQLTPSVDVYYGDAKAIKTAKSALETDEVVLTDESGTYKLTKLSVGDDYSISYGANIKAGKNKGSVTVTGNNLYGGSVTTKFTIKSRNVY